MGDAQNHNQQSMRFVLASGNSGYLKTAAGGRYVTSTERHERILLNVCEAFGITSYTGRQKVLNRLDCGVSLGAIVHFSRSNSLWIQESYSKVVTVPWYTTTSVGYTYSW